MQITAELVSFMIAVIVFVSGVWWRIEGKIKEAKTDAVLAASSAVAKTDLLASHLSEFRIDVAQNYVSKEGLREVRDEIMHGVRELKGTIDHLNQRIDRVIEQPAPAVPPIRRRTSNS